MGKKEAPYSPRQPVANPRGQCGDIMGKIFTEGSIFDG